MGVRFACQACGKRLHVKAELAGKRGICPKCGERFRIPLADQEWSIRLGSPEDPGGSAQRRLAPSLREDPPGVDQPADSGAQRSPRQRVGLLDSEPEAIWYVRPPSGGQYGPAKSPLLRQWVGEHRVAADALVWRDGWPQWREAIDVFPEYARELPGAPATAAEDDGTGTGPGVADNTAAGNTLAGSTAAGSTGTGNAGTGGTGTGGTGTGNRAAGEFVIGQAGAGDRGSAAAAAGEAAPGVTVEAEIRPVDPRRPALEGDVWLGSRRLARRNRRVWAIVVLVVISLLLVVALIIVSTRPPAATTNATPAIGAVRGDGTFGGPGTFRGSVGRRMGLRGLGSNGCRSRFHAFNGVPSCPRIFSTPDRRSAGIA